MSLVQLQVKGISSGQTQKGTYALILDNEKTSQKLPIIIGAYEAQAIAVALETRYVSTRPITHDLFKNFADKFKISIKQVIIYKLIDGVFYSNMICEQNGIEEILDARTSDAIALALRFNAPIFTYLDIIKKAGVHLSFKNEEEIEENIEDKEFDENIEYGEYSLQELNQMLQDAIALEDYETAAKIRDEISKRINS